MTKLEPWDLGLNKERAKINSALRKFTTYWSNYGVSIVSDGWTNVKGEPFINIFGVSASGAVFLSAHDYSEKFKTGMNIAELLQKKPLKLLVQTMSSRE